MIQILSSSTKAGEIVPAVCQQEAIKLAGLIARFPHPEHWSYLVACDDAMWRRVLVRLGVEVAPGTRHYAETSVALAMTVFRGATLLRVEDPLAEPEHVVAHELGHIALRSADEARCEALARGWLSQPLVASGTPPAR